jgi:hypothetical protein
MKWERAVHHLSALAASCAEWAEPRIGDFRVTQLWAVGDILGPPRDLDSVTVALGVDRPADEVAWWTQPRGAQHWANATRLSKNPVLYWWRSAHAPVWNHRIVRPALVWDAAGGEREPVLAALREGAGDAVREPAPTELEYAARMGEELRISLAAVRATTEEYERKRWAPGRLEPHADRLFEAANGYLDVLAAG